MAKKKEQPSHEKFMHHYRKKKMFMGFLLFIFGLVFYLGYSWDVALMVVGALVFLKGFMMKRK